MHSNRPADSLLAVDQSQLPMAGLDACVGHEGVEEDSRRFGRGCSLGCGSCRCGRGARRRPGVFIFCSEGPLPGGAA